MLAVIVLGLGASAADQTNTHLRSSASLLARKTASTTEYAEEKTQEDQRRLWFDAWWTERSQFRSPDKSGTCHAASLPFDGFFGSQVFKDLKIITGHSLPVARYLDVSRCPYTKASLAPRDGDTATLSSLRQCLQDHQSGNAIGCLFSPLSTCSTSKPSAEAGSLSELASAPDLSREAALCADAMCVTQLKRAVPVSPQLDGATGAADVSWLALQIFARMTAPVANLQRAVDEEVAKFRSANPESTGKCVAMHVRRGDKLPECDRGKESSCAFHKGLDEYLKPATAFLEQLHGGYVFVMTDDPSLLTEHATTGTPKDYKVVGLSGATPTSFEGSDGLEELITLLASLELGSSCDAVVGNSESEVTEMLVLANCARRGVCPSVHSMNGRPLQAFEGVIVDGRASTVNEHFDHFTLDPVGSAA